MITHCCLLLNEIWWFFSLQYIFFFSSLKCIYWKDRLIITLKRAYALPHFPRDRHFNKKQKSNYFYKNLFYFILQHLPKFLVENCRSYLLHLQDIFTIKFGDRKKNHITSPSPQSHSTHKCQIVVPLHVGTVIIIFILKPTVHSTYTEKLQINGQIKLFTIYTNTVNRQM